MSDVSSGHGEGLELPTGDELRAAREMRRRARIKIAIQAKHDGNPLYRERVRTALSKHWDGNGKRLTGVWALRDRVRALERTLNDVLVESGAAYQEGKAHGAACWGSALAQINQMVAVELARSGVPLSDHGRDRVRELERALADLRGLKTNHWVSDCGSTSAESALDEVARRVDAVLAPPPGHAQGESTARIRWVDD